MRIGKREKALHKGVCKRKRVESMRLRRTNEWIIYCLSKQHAAPYIDSSVEDCGKSSTE